MAAAVVSNFDNKSLDDVATMLATTAVNAREKRSFDFKQYMPDFSKIPKQLENYGINADAQRHIGYTLGGAGIGGLLGAGSQMFAPEKKRRYLSSALTGGLLGAGAGFGSSLIANNLSSLNKTKDEVRNDQEVLQAKNQAAREDTYATTPKLEAAGKGWAVDAGKLSELNRNVSRYGDAAIDDWITTSKNMGHEFRVPQGSSYEGLKPNAATGMYPYDQDPAVLRQAVKDMAASGAGGDTTRLGDLIMSPIRAIKDRTTAPLIGTRTRFGEGRDTHGFGKDLGEYLTKNQRLNATSPDYLDARDQLMKRFGLTPTEVLGAHADGSQATESLINEILAQKRMRMDGDKQVPWGDSDLRAQLPEITEELRRSLGRKSMLEGLPSFGNSYGDALAVGGGLQAGHMLNKYRQGGYTADRIRDVLSNKDGLPAYMKTNPLMEKYLNHAAAQPGGIENVLRDPAYYAQSSAAPKAPGVIGSRIGKAREALANTLHKLTAKTDQNLDWLRKAPVIGKAVDPTINSMGNVIDKIRPSQVASDFKPAPGFATNDPIKFGPDGKPADIKVHAAKAGVPPAIGRPAVPPVPERIETNALTPEQLKTQAVPDKNVLKQIAQKGKLLPNKLRAAGGLLTRVGLPLLATELLLGRGNVPLSRQAEVEAARERKWNREN